MHHSASQCGTACVAQVIQSTQEASQSARSAATSVASMVTAIEDMRTIVEDDQQTTESIEGQVIQLRIDMQDLSDEISSLRISVDNSMVPTIDNNIIICGHTSPINIKIQSIHSLIKSYLLLSSQQEINIRQISLCHCI